MSAEDLEDLRQENDALRADIRRLEGSNQTLSRLRDDIGRALVAAGAPPELGPVERAWWISNLLVSYQGISLGAAAAIVSQVEIITDEFAEEPCAQVLKARLDQLLDIVRRGSRPAAKGSPEHLARQIADNGFPDNLIGQWLVIDAHTVRVRQEPLVLLIRRAIESYAGTDARAAA